MIEAAISTPLLLLLTFSIVDFGALFFVYLSLENGVSQATPYSIAYFQAADESHHDQHAVRMRAERSRDPGSGRPESLPLKRNW